jgi:hypothetical protein
MLEFERTPDFLKAIDEISNGWTKLAMELAIRSRGMTGILIVVAHFC